MTNPDNFFVWIAKVTFVVSKLMVIGAYRGIKEKLDTAFEKSVKACRPPPEPEELKKALTPDGTPIYYSAAEENRIRLSKADDVPLGVNNSLLLHETEPAKQTEMSIDDLRRLDSRTVGLTLEQRNFLATRANLFPVYTTIEASKLKSPLKATLKHETADASWTEELVEGDIQRDRDGLTYVVARNECDNLYRRCLTQQVGASGRKAMTPKQLVAEYGAAAAMQLNEHAGPAFDADHSSRPYFQFGSIGDIVESIQKSGLIKTQDQYAELVYRLEHAGFTFVP